MLGEKNGQKERKRKEYKRLGGSQPKKTVTEDFEIGGELKKDWNSQKIGRRMTPT